MTMGADSRHAAFRALHNQGTFLMPNAWDAGSARMLAGSGFAAIGTTSAGIAFSMGLPDHQSVDREIMMARIHEIVSAVNIPVSADLQGGYGIDPAHVAETVRLAIAAGAVGCNIEDLGKTPSDLLDSGLAAERIHAARRAADASGLPFTLTARTDTFLTRHPDALAESIRRGNAFRTAGADCFFVPGITELETVRAVVHSVDLPFNMVMGLRGSALSVEELKSAGVRRISIGGSLARATFGLIRRAAAEMRDTGTFRFADQQVPHQELCDFFEKWENVDSASKD